MQLTTLVCPTVHAKRVPFPEDGVFGHFARYYPAEGDAVALANDNDTEGDDVTDSPTDDTTDGASTFTSVTLLQLVLIGANVVYAVGRMR